MKDDMKILWLTAMPLPAKLKAESSAGPPTGGWISSMLNQLSALDCVSSIYIVGVHRKHAIEITNDGKFTHIRIPSRSGVFSYDHHLAKQLNQVISDYRPDIIDVQGVEFYLANSLLALSLDIPIVATLQGLVSECTRHYNAGIPTSDILKCLTLRNFIRPDGLFSGRRNYLRRGKNEIDCLKRLTYFTGRTEWDKAHTLAHNPNLKYYHCDRVLRAPFYQHQWKLRDVKRFTIFTTQAKYPLKGLHVLLKAIQILKRDYPSVKLYIGGKDLLDKTGLIKRLSFSDYQKYIASLLRKLHLENNVFFTGLISADEVAQHLCRANVFVIPSFIDNSPNALAEAQAIGTPVVASLVGGIGSYVKDGATGLLYAHNEPLMLASKIRSIFGNDALAILLSNEARLAAHTRHDPIKNANTLVNVYNQIINDYHHK